MDIKITIPDDKKEAIIAAFATQYKYQEEVTNPEYDSKDENSSETIPNPVTKGSFALNIIKSFIREVYVAAQVKELDLERQAVIQTAQEETENIVVS